MISRDRGRSRRGNNIIEFSLAIPWFIFLFVGAFDFGFYSYSMIATQNAARIAATYCSANSSTCTTNDTYACSNYVIGQLSSLPNIGSTVTTCAASPLTLTVSYPAAASCPDGNTCVSATVAYVTPQLIALPGILPAQPTVTRAVTMRLRG